MRPDKYTIRHFDLSADSLSVDLQKTGPCYAVFWYKSVPLGEHYFSHTNSLTDAVFWQTCAESIWPALQHHAGKLGMNFRPEKPNVIDQAKLRLNCEIIINPIHPASTPDQCDVSIVICTRNRAPFLENCLLHLTRQVCKPAEIIVVDNGSATDDTRNVCALFNDVRYVREDRPGLDIARNRGAQEASASVIAYTDDDTIPDPYWVYRVSEGFRDSAVSATTGLVIAASLETEAEIIFEKYWPFNRGYVSKLYDFNFFNSKLESGPPVWEIGAGANMAFRKTIFAEVGYFDERLDVGAAGCSGDSEMWYRILANGFSILYDPLAVVQHTHRSSIRDLKRQLFSYMRGFTVAILIQYQRFGHRGNLQHLLKVIPLYYLSLLRKGFPDYSFQYQTLFSEVKGIISGFFYYWRNKNREPKIYL